MDRRSFMTWVGIGWLASCLPIAIAACTNTEKTDGTDASAAPLPAPRKDGYQAVGKAADLQKRGYLLVKGFAGGTVLVVRNPKNPRSLSAVNPTCTHKGCVVEWKGDSSAFVCPCHAATFGAGGNVVKGPATQPLKTFTARLEGDTVFVKA